MVMRMLLDIFGPDPAHLVGAQAALFPDHVRDCLGSGVAVAADRGGEGFRSGNRKALETLGKKHHFLLRRTGSGAEGQLHLHAADHLTYDDYLDIMMEVRMGLGIAPLIERDDIHAVSDYISTGGKVTGGSLSITRYGLLLWRRGGGSTMTMTTERRRSVSSAMK